MLVKTLLNQAKNCLTAKDAQVLADYLEKAFGHKGPMSNLISANQDSQLESLRMPYVSVEFNHVISQFYITMIRPEIRDAKLAIVVRTSYMKDGLGMMSRNYDVHDDMDAVIDCDDSSLDVRAYINRAVALAKEHHQQLVEQVGINAPAARIAVDKSWK
ncbi:MAG: hypothetical protein Q7S87_10175 [Agitococcus sp.]|nr:hypothetical protein [Agitococcus sp.]